MGLSSTQTPFDLFNAPSGKRHRQTRCRFPSCESNRPTNLLHLPCLPNPSTTSFLSLFSPWDVITWECIHPNYQLPPFHHKCIAGWLSVVLKLRKQNARRTYVKTRRKRKRMCIARGNRSTDRMERHPDSSGTCFPSKRNLPQFLVGLEAAAAPAAATTIYNHENDALPVGVS